MRNLRWIFLFLIYFIGLGYCTNARYYDGEFYTDCFQNAPGWYNLAASCIFPLTQFERNYSTAIKMCGSVNHSIGYRETNWLIVPQLMEIFTTKGTRDLNKMYWTGLVINDENTIGVELEDASDTDIDSVAPFTSIYNPLWAIGQPSATLQMNGSPNSCIALDLRNSSNYGWRAVSCNSQLPILCQNYACIPGTFRCLDNSKCIPASLKNDGFNDCLDGSDESTKNAMSASSSSSSTQNTLLSHILRENPIYNWPMIVSNKGILTPSTIKYGRGECTHKWTVLSPNDKHFMIWIEWMNPTTTTTIFIEGRDQNGRIFLNSRNATSSFSMQSSSFLLTASDTDTRKIEFKIHYQEIDNSLCKISENHQISFNSENIPMKCHYRFSTKYPSSYIALLIQKCDGPFQNVSSIQFNNSTISLNSNSIKRLLIIPSNSLSIHVNSTWPQTETILEIQLIELRTGDESVDLFLIDSEFEIEWIPRSNDICMEGEFRTLTVNMIMTSSDDISSFWRTDKFRKSCSEDNVQIISRNQSTFLMDSGVLTGFGPTTVIIHHSAEPFEFRSFYQRTHQDVAGSSGRFLDVIDEEVNVSTQTSIGITTASPGKKDERCKLPKVTNGYIQNVSTKSYEFGTEVSINCNQGYILNPLPFILKCIENGKWIDHNGQTYDGEPPQVQCYSIKCPEITPIETQFSLIPNNNDRFYGAVRRYQNVTTELGFGPLCICGDYMDCIDCWQCYNDNYLKQLIPNACILPEVPDAIFIQNPYQIIFETGNRIEKQCMLCPQSIYSYVCQNGLWINSEGNIQPYDSFKCDCFDKNDPCEPHGTYVLHTGFYSCNCDKGYKFKDGTCLDIDECSEKSDYCDPDISTCINTDGGFKCSCHQDFHTFFKNQTLNNEWDDIEKYLIDGYSCIEWTCPFSDSWNTWRVNVSGPFNSSNWYKSGSLVGYSYVQSFCGPDCVLQLEISCSGNTLTARPDPLTSCPEIDTNIFNIVSGYPRTAIFGTAELSCKSEQLLIGRPKVFCNATAQWEIMPICVYQSCSNITHLVVPPLKISNISSPNSGFEKGTTVYFECDSGKPLIDSISCISFEGSYDWSDPLPICVETTTSSTTPSTTQSFMYPTSPFPHSTYYPFASSTHHSSPFPFASTRTTPIAHGSTPMFYDDDIVIEGSRILEEVNILERQELWTSTGDWKWTSSGCIVHEWTFPISFLVTSIPFELNSDEIELLIDISQCDSSLQVSISTSIDGFIPPISDFRPILNTTSSGSFVVKLSNLKPFMALSINANGFVRICGITVRENMCDEVDFNGIHFASSKPFSMRKYILATCGNKIAPINGYCDSRRGWVVQNKPCICNPKPSCITSPLVPQREQSGICDLNSCRNGECHQHQGYFSCSCNENFFEDSSGSEPTCKPDNCKFTSSNRNSGYNCKTGEDEPSFICEQPGFLGDFCQLYGYLRNNSYIYILKEGASTATATNVCGNALTLPAIPDVNCQERPELSCPNDPCNVTCFDGHNGCERNAFYCGAYCNCDEHQYGRSCIVRKDCFDENDVYICLNGGTCNLAGNNTFCNCTSDFYGSHCENAISISNCIPGEKVCGNGTCRRENDQVYCNCDDGFVKDSDGNCTIKWDMCSLNDPCQQYGICNFNDSTGKLTCDCDKSGWKGDYCETQPKLDDCSVCNNTERCLDTFSSNVRCQCSLGYSGENCTNLIDDCQFDPCFNDGQCQKWNYIDHITNAVESYNCSCASGWTGLNCQDLLVCNITCQNGGSCGFDDSGHAVCYCTDQFYGDSCQFNCSSECVNSYACKFVNGTPNCSCFPGYDGPFCDRVDNVCTANILLCENSGICNPITQKCNCTDMFSGTYCENNLNLCETNSIHCENDGICKPETGKCECQPNFTGDLCETQIHSCANITCNNGGTCFPSNETCACLPGTTGDFCENLGQPCTILQPDGSTVPYCVHGLCLNQTNGATCNCTGTEYTGRRCEIKSFVNFNLVFNGLDYSPDIVSPKLYNISVAQFTICSFVQYNHPIVQSSNQNETLPPWLSMRGYSNDEPQFVFDNKGFYICTSIKDCSREKIPERFRQTPITANTWHHYCLVSSVSELQPNYTVYLDGVPSSQLAFAVNFTDTVHLQLAPSYFNNSMNRRFEGMISMTQLYNIRLNESQIGQLAFNCDSAIKDPIYASTTLINWNGGFTRVSSSNPGVFIDPAGICSSVKCMFGRQPNTNNFNTTGSCEKDRISPTVLKCPRNKYGQTTQDFMKMKWGDEEISFFDNIGVIRIEVNYQNGQQFGIGITVVRYVAFDEAGNSAECSFDVIVVRNVCPSKSQTFVEGGTISFPSFNAPYSNVNAIIKCDDQLYPIENRPRFYVCDIMGNYNYGGWINEENSNQKRYYLPACGKTSPALQELNGTVIGNGSCEQIHQKLWNTIYSSANCDQTGSCKLTISPSCNQTTNSFWNSRETDNSPYSVQYIFKTSNAIETISLSVLQSLRSNFPVVNQESKIECNSSYPIQNVNGNITVCVKCPEGTYANETLNKCIDCPINTYRNSSNIDQLKCVQCPENKITGDVTGSVDESQCYQNCHSGEYESNGLCLPCPTGTYTPNEGFRKCISCGFDVSTDGPGKKSSDDCSVYCESGQEMIRDDSKTEPFCQDCDTGFYKNATRGACIQCPRGLTTLNEASKSNDACNIIYCLDENTMRNTKIKANATTPYSEMCISCKQGSYQNIPNSDHCIPCTNFPDDIDDRPVTCLSTCYSSEDDCNCQLKIGNNSMIIRNCEPVVTVKHRDSSALVIVLSVVFGALLIIIIIVLLCFKKQILEWFRKSETSDNQHVSISHWNEPRPDLRIITSRHEMDQLPPLSPSNSSLFRPDSGYRNNIYPNGIGDSSGFRHLGSPPSTDRTLISSPIVSFEHPIQRQIPRNDSISDNDSMFNSFF